MQLPGGIIITGELTSMSETLWPIERVWTNLLNWLESWVVWEILESLLVYYLSFSFSFLIFR